MQFQWIWGNDGLDSENERLCFVREFTLPTYGCTEFILKISAVTRYIAYLDGKEIGRGPVRTSRKERAFDVYNLSSYLLSDRLTEVRSHSASPIQKKHLLCFRVWHYKWSTYQSIGQLEGALAFDFICNGKILMRSDTKVRFSRDYGHLAFAPKRNVNLGFTDYYDARKMSQAWLYEPMASHAWPPAVLRDPWNGPCLKRPIREFHRYKQYAQALIAHEETKNRSQQWTINTRRAFFGNRFDADENIFSGFLGAVIEVPKAMDGHIVFPNRSWNSLMGDFKLGGQYYHVSNSKRDLDIKLKPGRQLFLLQLSGKYDDLYCHMEWIFPEQIHFRPRSENDARVFFVIGPTGRIISQADGIEPVYGGQNEFNSFEHYSEKHLAIFAVNTLEDLFSQDVEIKWVNEHDCYKDLYLLSKVMSDEIVRRYTLPNAKNLGILWDNGEETILPPPDVGDSRRILLDFGRIQIGSISFTVWAASGTILDIYGFENIYWGEIDHTIGLNNSVRYICRGGWQNYCCMTRMGLRYALIIVRRNSASVRFRDFHIEASTYSPTQAAQFECSDERLNKIWLMCRDTHLLSMDDCFSDSPTYEQAFWQGDAQINELVNAYLFGDYEYIFRSQKLASKGLENTPLLNALAPTDWTTAIPLWTMNWIISVFQLADICGQDSFARELYPQMKDTLHYYAHFIQSDGAFLINAWNMLDWAPLDIENYAVVTGQQAALAYCYTKVAELAKKLEDKDIAITFSNFSERLKHYIDTMLWDSEKLMYRDGYIPGKGISSTFSIQSHIMLYLYKAILDPQKRDIVKRYLLCPPNEFIDVGSPFMLGYLYECWAANGMVQKIFDDIVRRWLEMVRFNSNTCWEVFPGFYENCRTRSYCHGWSATPAYFMIKLLSGIKPLDPHYGSLAIELPEIDLNWCRICLPTAQGRITVEWERIKGKTRLLLQLPENITVVNADTLAFECKIVRLKSTTDIKSFARENSRVHQPKSARQNH